jgi:hypothetical protein
VLSVESVAVVIRTRICVPEHFPDVVQRPAPFKASAPGVVPELMEMEVDASESRLGFRRERAVDSGGRLAVRLQNGGLASRHDLRWPIFENCRRACEPQRRLGVDEPAGRDVLHVTQSPYENRRCP